MDIPHPEQARWKTPHNDWKEWARCMSGLSLMVAGFSFGMLNGGEKGFTFKNIRAELALLVGGLLILKKSDFISHNKYRSNLLSPDKLFLKMPLLFGGFLLSWAMLLSAPRLVILRCFNPKSVSKKDLRIWKNCLILGAPFISYFLHLWFYAYREGNKKFARTYVFPGINEEKFLSVEHAVQSSLFYMVWRNNPHCNKLPAELIEHIISFCHCGNPWAMLCDTFPDEYKKIESNLTISNHCLKHLQHIQYEMIGLLTQVSVDESVDKITLSGEIKNNVLEQITLMQDTVEENVLLDLEKLIEKLRDDFKQEEISISRLEEITREINRHTTDYKPLNLLRRCWTRSISLSFAKRAKEDADDLKDRHTVFGLCLLRWFGKKCSSRFMDTLEQKLYNAELKRKYWEGLYEEPSITVSVSEAVRYFYPYERYDSTRFDRYIVKTLSSRLDEILDKSGAVQRLIKRGYRPEDFSD